jgi:hypothetical protein
VQIGLDGSSNDIHHHLHRRLVLVQSICDSGAIRELIEVHGGGVREGRVVKAVFPGASIALLPAAPRRGAV